MANTYKNIVITPNTGSSTGDPTIVFSGANASVNTDITIRAYPDSNGTLSFEGSAGQLFSVTNDLTGSIFSVNDSSGFNLFDVNVTSQQITSGLDYGNVGIGTANATYKLDVAGDIRSVLRANSWSGPPKYDSFLGNYTSSIVTSPSYTVNTAPNWANWIGLLSTPTANSYNGSSAYIIGTYNIPKIINSATSDKWYMYGTTTLAYRNSANDNANVSGSAVTGAYTIAGHSLSLPNTAFSNYVLGTETDALNYSGTVTTLYGLSAYVGVGATGNNYANTLTAYSIYTSGDVGLFSGVSNTVANVGSYYDAYFAGMTARTAGSVTNKYGVYQVKTDHTNYFAGPMTLANANVTIAGSNVLSAIAAGNTLAYSYANTTQGAAQSYTNTMTGVANVWANTVAGYSNTWANTVAGYSNTWANTKVSSVTGTAGQIFSSGGTTPTLNLISTGVSATTYGGTTQIPAIVVDSFGRITSASNVAFSSGSMDYAYANAVGTGANNQAGLMANAANSAATTREGYSNNWANTVAGISNNWANTVSGYANTWANTKLSNTSGVSFAGNLYFPSGSLGVGTSNPRTQIEIIGPSTYSALTFNVAAGVANTRVYDIIATTSNTIGYRLVNEAYTAATTYYIINRELMNISSQIWYAGAGTEAFRIDNVGNLGIGTSGPAFKLDVNGNMKANSVYGSSLGDGILNLYSTSSSAGPNWTDAITFNTINAGKVLEIDSWGGMWTGIVPSPKPFNYTGASTTMWSYYDFSFTYPQSAINWNTYVTSGVYRRIAAGHVAVIVPSSDGAITFLTNNITAAANTTVVPNERMRISNTGNVGIGNTNPDQRLVVAGSIRISDYGAIGPQTNNAGIAIHGGAAIGGNPTQSGIIFRGNTAGAGGTANNGLEFYGGGSERMRLDVSGNVGIGTSNPIYKLDVAGSLNVSSGGAIAGGFTVASFNAGSNIAAYGTWTPNPTNGNYQYVTSNGSVTIAVPTSNCAIDVLWYNGVSPGSVTFSGYQAASGGGGDSYLTTANYEYILSIRRINGLSTYVWKALQ